MDVCVQLLTVNEEKSEFYSHILCFFKCQCEFFHVIENVKHRLTIPDKRAVDQVRKTFSVDARAMWQHVNRGELLGREGPAAGPRAGAPPPGGRTRPPWPLSGSLTDPLCGMWEK